MDEKRAQVGTGDRSEKIRTYNFKDNRITDHRINQNFNLQYVLEGDLEKVIDANIMADNERKLKESLWLSSNTDLNLSFADCQTIGEARERVVKALKEVGIERVEVRREADLIIEHVTRMSAAERALKFDELLEMGAREELEAILKRRVKREPLQYCLGYGWFMGLRIVVHEGVFIPRTDTETLCDLTTKRLLAMGILK